METLNWILGNWELIAFVISTSIAVVQRIKNGEYEAALQKVGDAFNRERLKGQAMRQAIEEGQKETKEKVRKNSEDLGVRDDLHADVVADKKQEYATPLHEVYGRNKTVRTVADIVASLSGLRGIFSR